MKNIASLKSHDTNSPKTPGGISRSLLTPCRRLGLSRNWRKSGPSPFISPLAGASGEAAEEKKETRKRKDRVRDENSEQTDASDQVSIEQIAHTPSRNVDAPRRKKSKTLLADMNKSQDHEKFDSDKCIEGSTTAEIKNDDNHITEKVEVVSTPVRTKSLKSKKRSSPVKNNNREPKKTQSEKHYESTATVEPKNVEEAIYTIKEKSPNELRKECIVVIQKRIFKNVKDNTERVNTNSDKEKNNLKAVDSSSDSDEAPLISIQKQNSVTSNSKVVHDDNDFIENKPKAKLNKVKDSKSPKNKQKTAKSTKITAVKTQVDPKPSTQSCFDDDDDFDNKKTILIRKTYDKVSKPLKAKSTGSITQKDIDNLRDRIEAKKKLLLAQSLTPDTQELRTLIKKWQKGCQDALMELLDLMRNKFPDKGSLDYSEMLRTLKIPPSLVGYDSENDCFISPDDASIILGQFKNI